MTLSLSQPEVLFLSSLSDLMRNFETLPQKKTFKEHSCRTALLKTEDHDREEIENEVDNEVVEVETESSLERTVRVTTKMEVLQIQKKNQTRRNSSVNLVVRASQS